MVVGDEVLVLEEIVDQGSIVAVHCRAEETNEASNIKLHRPRSERPGRLLDHCLVEDLISLDDLDYDLLVFPRAIMSALFLRMQANSKHVLTSGSA